MEQQPCRRWWAGAAAACALGGWCAGWASRGRWDAEAVAATAPSFSSAHGGSPARTRGCSAHTPRIEFDMPALLAEGELPEVAAATGSSKALDGSNRLLRKAETVIRRRTSQLLIVIERTNTSHNYSAVLRTAEALGVQHVCFDKDEEKRAQMKKKAQWQADKRELREHVAFAREATKWLTLRHFETTAALVAALREDGRAIWVTDLSQNAEVLEVPGAGAAEASPRAALPSRLAICFGAELSGASVELLRAADKRVYLPLHGFADSLNLSVAAALIVHALLLMAPDAVGAMSSAERAELRSRFYPAMGRRPQQIKLFAQLAARMNDVMGEVHNTAGEPIVQPFGDLRRHDSHRIDQGANCLSPMEQPRTST